MAPCPAEETILAFVEHRMRPEQRSSTEAHVAECDSCGALLAAVTSSLHAEGRLPRVDEPEPRLLSAGDQIGPYTIIEHAGNGAMGDVYRARDGRLGREVALKVLPARFAAEPARLARFRQEARAAGSLSHPNLLALFDVGTHEGVPYLVSEWLSGTTLRDRLRTGPLPAERALRLAAQLARGLAAAHDKGVVHRDIKPANIFLCADGSCRILDFGLARLTETVGEADLTQTGAVVGTAGYMAPEQIRGHAVDHRADLFSLGAVLYEAITGRPPFDGNSVVERMSAALRDDPPPLDGELGPVLARCLAKSPSERFQSAHDLAFTLETLAKTSSAPRTELGQQSAGAATPGARRSRRRTLALSAVALVTIAALAGVASLLARGRFTAATGPAAASHPTYRPVTFRRGHVLNARFSADGHTVVYGAAWEGNRAELYSTRTERALSQPFGVAADVLAVSPEGELAVLLDPRFFDSDHGTGTLARMPLAGGAPRPVLEGVLEADWSADGRQLAVVRRIAGRFRLELPAGTIRFESEGWISHARISPSGEQIAFLFHPSPKDDRGVVMVLGREGAPRELTPSWASARGLAWAPDGREIWFTASTSGADSALHAVNLAGEVRLVDRIAGRMLLHDIAANGTALVDHQSFRTGVVFSRDGQERELTWSEFSFLTDMSSDGRTVVFSEGASSEGEFYGAYLRKTDGSPPVRLGDGIPLALSPDGQWVFTARYGATSEFLLLPTGAGEPRPLRLAPIELVLGARWFPDGRALLVRGSERGRTPRLWRVEPGGEAPKPITGEGINREFAISPDGHRIAFSDDAGKLRLIAETGEPIGEVPGQFPGQTVLGWDSAGEVLFVRSISLPVQVSRVNVRTGVLVPFLSVPSGADRPGLLSVMTMAVSRDGSAYAFSYREVLSRLYLVDGLPSRGD